tara:strand:+ start:301 stop:756 length:456 start_codon:yes stop_codon:yes gene_type:complete
MSLSDHFSLMELTKSQTAERLGIDNTPDDVAIGNLASMCDSILEPIRAHYGVPFSPSSAYRSEELNKAIGGSVNPTSAHVRGLAVDIELPGVSNPDLARWVQNNLVFDQLILECWTVPGSGWVHIGDDLLEPRGQVLTYTRGKGYMNGLPG